MKLQKLAGATSEVWQVFIQDSSSAVGAGLTGLVFNSAGLAAYFHRDNDTAATAISLVTMTVGTFTSGGFKEIDAANMPGWYQFCPPNAALAAGAKSVGIHLKGATNMAPLPMEVQLTAGFDYDNATPNVNTTKVGGTTQTARDLGASVLISSGTGAGQLDVTSGVVKANLVQILATALTETAGQLAAGFKKFFNIASPASTMDALTLVATATTLTNAPPDSSGVTTLLTRIPSALFSGITSLAQWLGMLAGKQSGDATALSEIRATGGGSGTFTPTTDSGEAIRDNMGTAQTGDAYARLGAPAGASTAADIAAIKAVLPSALVGGRIDASIGAVASGAMTRAGFAADTGLQPIRSNTAQAGASGSITLDASASTTDDFYNNTIVLITGGLGVGQVRLLQDYVGSSRLATVKPAWSTAPDNTSTFSILPRTSVWDEVLADHLASGSTGAALNAAGSAGDPWATTLPGAYGAGTAGKIIGDNVDAKVSTRLAPTTAGRTLDVSAGGEAGLDWSNIGSPSTSVNLSGTTIGVVTALASGAIAAATFAANALDAVWTATTRLLTAGTNIVLAKGTGLTGLNDLDASGVRGAVGLAAANLDTQLAGIQADTDNLQTRVPAALVGGRMDASVGNYQSGLAPLDAAGTRAAVGLASANLDTQLAAIAAYIDTEVAAIKAVTDQFVTAQSEPVAVPAANATPLQKIAWMAALARNKVTQTATTQALRNDADSANIATATVSDDGSTFARNEWQ